MSLVAFGGRSSDLFLYVATPSRAFLFGLAQWLNSRPYISRNLQLRDSSGLSPDSLVPPNYGLNRVQSYGVLLNPANLLR